LQLIDKYQNLIEQGEIIDDVIQRQLISELQIIFDALTTSPSWFGKWFTAATIKGLYMWGGVGIGKTFLMDLFFNALPFDKKMRIHFHGFMQQVQEGLRARQGQINPLNKVAAEIAQNTTVLCFDEFFVSDIADAMILERLFNALFKKGVVLVATSNIPPEKLYLKGLHRARFLPVIELINNKCKVVDVASHQDYRYRALKQAGVYFVPDDVAAETQMLQIFEQYSNHQGHENVELTIENRKFIAKRCATNVVWFDFNVICHTPRSQVDFLRIAEKYHIVLISHMPVISKDDHATITYLIHLVDVFYDKKIKLILSAAADIEQIYTEGDKFFEFQRTLSRLHEMRTAAYLEAVAQSHISKNPYSEA
jgi:cell division protein ZapE